MNGLSLYRAFHTHGTLQAWYSVETYNITSGSLESNDSTYLLKSTLLTYYILLEREAKTLQLP